MSNGVDKKIPNEIAFPIIITVTVVIAGLVWLATVDRRNQVSMVYQPTVTVGQSQNKGCPEDAKICPDGATVVRIEPDCEFAKCQEIKNTPVEKLPEMTIIQAKEKYELELMEIDGVVGVGVGECDGESCILVLLKKETSETKDIPSQLEGFEVVKKVTGDIKAN